VVRTQSGLAAQHHDLQPFGNHAHPYAAGSILPSQRSQAQLDQVVRATYDAERDLMLAPPSEYVCERCLSIGKLRIELDGVASELLGPFQRAIHTGDRKSAGIHNLLEFCDCGFAGRLPLYGRRVLPSRFVPTI
jgi:hypothetical protein